MSHRLVVGGRVLVLGFVLAHVLVQGSASFAQPGLHLRGLSGRFTGLAGAGSASVADASAVVADPAMLSRLDRFSVLLAESRTDQDPFEFSIEGTFESSSLDLEDNEPAAFVAWRPGGNESRIGLGLGYFSPYRSEARWGLDSFRRFDARVEVVDLEELVGAVAFRFGHWSAAIGPRRVSGSLDSAFSVSLGSPVSTAFRGEADVQLQTDVDGWGWTAAIDHQRERWGAALVARSEVELDTATDRTEVDLVDFFLAGEFVREEATRIVQGQLAILRDYAFQQAFDLPLELRLGAWVAVGPRLTLSLDASQQQWSESTSRTTRFGFTTRFPLFDREPTRDFDDTLGVRLGADVALTPRLRLYAGAAREESFVLDDTIDPAFPWGDAQVLSAGLGWSGKRFGIDAAFAQLDLDDQVLPGNLRDTTISSDRSEATISLKLSL